MAAIKDIAEFLPHGLHFHNPDTKYGTETFELIGITDGFATAVLYDFKASARQEVPLDMLKPVLCKTINGIFWDKNGLIEKGEAVDAHTLKNNPYDFKYREAWK